MRIDQNGQYRFAFWLKWFSVYPFQIPIQFHSTVLKLCSFTDAFAHTNTGPINQISVSVGKILRAPASHQRATELQKVFMTEYNNANIYVTCKVYEPYDRTLIKDFVMQHVDLLISLVKFLLL